MIHLIRATISTKFSTLQNMSIIAVALMLTVCPTLSNAFAICQEGTEDPPLELRWKKLPKPDSLVTLPTSQLPLLLRNKTKQTLVVTIQVAGALDAMREGIQLETIMAAPLSDTNVAFDLSQFNANIGNLQFSGRLVARAAARIKRKGPVEYLAYSPHAFVHLEQGKIHAYRIKPLQENYGFGDFGNRATKLRQWAQNRGIKLAGIGHVARNLQLNDNDGGPKEER